MDAMGDGLPGPSCNSRPIGLLRLEKLTFLRLRNVLVAQKTHLARGPLNGNGPAVLPPPPAIKAGEGGVQDKEHGHVPDTGTLQLPWLVSISARKKLFPTSWATMSVARLCCRQKMVAWPGRGPRLAHMPPWPDRAWKPASGAHHLSRKLRALGHDARLDAGEVCSPLLQGAEEWDFRDAEAIAEAVQATDH